MAAKLGIAVLCLAAGAIAAETPEKQEVAPLLTGTNTNVLEAPPRQLLVFHGSMLLNPFVYTAVINLPDNAAADQTTAHLVAGQIADFLRTAGYELATVRTEIKDDQIHVTIDEGALDKVIVAGLGWLGALRFRAKLNLPLDVFNRKLFDVQMPQLAKQFGMMGYRYELWPVHMLDDDNSGMLAGVEELRAMPGIRAARGYELRIFAKTEPWSTGFSPEIILNGQVGFGIGGRYRWKDIIQPGDRWQSHFRIGGTMRAYLDGSGSRPVNTLDYLSVRWLSRPWNSEPSGIRMTIVPRGELWELQRRDLMLESYRVGLFEIPVGAGANFSREFGLFFTLGWQRRWFFNETPANCPKDPDPSLACTPGLTPPQQVPLHPDVAIVPAVDNRLFLRANSEYTFNPSELRKDLRDTITVQADAYQPTTGATKKGFFRFDLQTRWLFPLGWHELRTGAHISGESGDILFLDEMPLADHLRVGFGLEKYTERAASINLEFRYSVLRDKVKIGVFTDLGLWRHLPRDDPKESASGAGSAGGCLGLFLFDEIQVDAYYGLGWASDGYSSTGLSLQIKEAF